MIVRLDKRLFEILTEMGGNVDAEMFKTAYAKRKEEKANDPRLQQQAKMTQMTYAMMSGIKPKF